MDITEKVVSFQIIQNVINGKTTLTLDLKKHINIRLKIPVAFSNYRIFIIQR